MIETKSGNIDFDELARDVNRQLQILRAAWQVSETENTPEKHRYNCVFYYHEEIERLRAFCRWKTHIPPGESATQKNQCGQL